MVFDKNYNENNAMDTAHIIKKIKDILNEAKVEIYDNRIPYKLMQYAYFHVTNVLENAKKYSEHANKKWVDTSDISLALERNREELNASTSRFEIIKIASDINKEPLPLIKSDCGIALPAEKYCLTNLTYKLKILSKMEKTVSVVMPKPQMITNNSFLSANTMHMCNTNSTIMKRSKLANMSEQKIVFKPRLKMNIKTEDDRIGIKKPRII